MSSGSQARWLAPLALVAALIAVGFIVTSSAGDEADSPPTASQGESGETSTATGASTGEAAPSGETTDTTETTSTTARTEDETYTVQAGDTFGAIAEETGVPVADLQELNPTVDSQALTVGQELRLSR